MSVTNEGSSKPWILFVFLLLILGVGVANLLWPRSPTISVEAVAGIQQATAQMERVAENVERSTNAMTDLNKSLILQMRDRAAVDDKGYEDTLKKYGIDLGLPASGSLANGLQQRTLDQGGGYIPPSSGAANPAGQLPQSSESSTGRVDRSNPGAKELPSGNAPKPPQ